jgi:uncharacterized protein (TIGR03083 family)
MADNPALIDAYEQTVGAMVALGDGLSQAQWATPTECPGWTVQDVMAHTVGVELTLMGEPQPAHELPDGLDHLQHDTARVLEVPVDARRGRPGTQVLAELRDVAARRTARLRELAAGGADPEVDTAFWGTRPLSRALRTRIFDVWAHEQDIRRALGRPGGLDSAAAAVTREFLARTLPYVVEQAELPDGAAVRFDVSGEQEIHQTVGDGEPMVAISTDWETFVRLMCGRVDPRLAKVVSTGDPAQVGRVLAALAITP